MRLLTGCVVAVLALAATSAAAQVTTPVPVGGTVIAVSDFDGPYAPSPPPLPPRYGYGTDEPAPGPLLLPAIEVYAVLRENGFSPLGIPRLRGGVYTIAAIDRRGDDGRLVIDARNGRILRFLRAVDAYGMAPPSNQPAVIPAEPSAALPPPTLVRGGPPRPPAPIPHVAGRSVPLPKAAPLRSDGPLPQAQPSQQTAAVAKPAEAAPGGAATVGQAKPAPTILPTQEMPAAQGLD